MGTKHIFLEYNANDIWEFKPFMAAYIFGMYHWDVPTIIGKYHLVIKHG